MVKEENEIQFKIEDMEGFQQFIYSGDMYLLYALLIFMAIDVITGWAKALKNGHLWSKKSLYGAGLKVLALFVVIIANIIDNILSLNGTFVVIIMFYYIATEGLSILENLAEMNVPFPEQIKKKLEVLKNKGDGNHGSD